MNNLENELVGYRVSIEEYNEGVEERDGAVVQERYLMETCNELQTKLDETKRKYESARAFTKQIVNVVSKLESQVTSFDPIAVVVDEIKTVSVDLRVRNALYSSIENLPDADEKEKLLDPAAIEIDNKRISAYQSALEIEDLEMAESIHHLYEQANINNNKRNDLEKISETMTAGIVVNKKEDNIELYVSVDKEEPEGLSLDLVATLGNTLAVVDDVSYLDPSYTNGIMKVDVIVKDQENFISILESQVPENFADANVEYKVIVLENLESKVDSGSVDGQQTPPTDSGDNEDGSTINSDDELVEGSFKAEKVYTQKEAAQIFEAKAKEVLGTALPVNSYIKILSGEISKGKLPHIEIDGKKQIAADVLTGKIEDYFSRKLIVKSDDDGGQQTPPPASGAESGSSPAPDGSTGSSPDKVYTQAEAAKLMKERVQIELGTSLKERSYAGALGSLVSRGKLASVVEENGRRCIPENALNEYLGEYLARKTKTKTSTPGMKVESMSQKDFEKEPKPKYAHKRLSEEGSLEEELGISLRKLFADKDYLPIAKTSLCLGHADNYLYFGEHLDFKGGPVKTKKEDDYKSVNLKSLEKHLGPNKLYSTRDVALIWKERAEKELGTAYDLESYKASLNRDIREDKVNAIKVGIRNFVPQKQMDIYLGNYFARRKIGALEDETISSKDLANLLMISTTSVNNKAKHGCFEKDEENGMYSVDSAKNFVENHAYNGRGWVAKE